jgi:transposase
MRSSFDKLSSLVSNVLGKDPVSGHLFMFFNRQRTHVKVLYFDRSGYAIWYKRLERGTFSVPSQEEIEYREVVCILEGLTNMRKKLRYEQKK